MVRNASKLENIWELKAVEAVLVDDDAMLVDDDAMSGSGVEEELEEEEEVEEEEVVEEVDGGGSSIIRNQKVRRSCLLWTCCLGATLCPFHMFPSACRQAWTFLKLWSTLTLCSEAAVTRCSVCQQW